MTGWTPDHAISAGGPGWWSGNSVVLTGCGDQKDRVLKAPRPHSVLLGETDSQLSLKSAAAVAGLGPATTLTADGLEMPDLRASGFQVATYLRVIVADAVEALAHTHRAVGRLDATLPTVDPFDELARLRGILSTLPVTPPTGVAELEYLIPELRARLADGPAPEPSFCDATLSNVMLGPEAEILLLGGTLAARVDPLYTAGCLIAELAPHVARAEEVFEAFWGSSDREAFTRARLYSVVDDLRWAYTSRIATALNDDSGFVSSLYGIHRGKRGKHTIKDPEFRGWKVAA